MGSWGRLSELTIGTSCGAGKRGPAGSSRPSLETDGGDDGHFHGKPTRWQACCSSRGPPPQKAFCPNRFPGEASSFVAGVSRLPNPSSSGGLSAPLNRDPCAALCGGELVEAKRVRGGKQGSSFWRRFCAAAHSQLLANNS